LTPASDSPPASAPPELDESGAVPGAVPGAASGRVPLGALLSWGPPIVGLSSALFFLQFFFLKFATDVLLLAPALVGGLFAAGRLWDAVSDPIVGTRSDRTRTRLGRRRPWMLTAIPLLVVFIWMIWVPPASLSGTALVLWVSTALFGFYTAFTIYQIPHISLGAELTTDHKDRNRIFGVQSASFNAGMIFAFGSMQYIMTSDDPRGATQLVASVLCVLVVGTLLIPPLRVRERSEHQGRGATNPIRAMRDVFQNTNAVRLLIVQFVMMIGVSGVGLLSPYLMEYVLKRPDMVAALPAAFLVATIGSIPIWVKLTSRFGKRDTWRVALVLSSLSFGGMAFAGEGDVLLLAILLPIAGFATGCGGMVSPSMLADVIDGDELKTGERKEGAYNAAWGFALKVANAAMILFASLVLQGLGFVPNEEQSDQVLIGLRLLYGGFPFVMFLGAAWVLRGYQLDEKEHSRIRAELDTRRG
jgi:GPH family glycoside/pentoside/hexuronide:cation symporter